MDTDINNTDKNNTEILERFANIHKPSYKPFYLKSKQGNKYIYCAACNITILIDSRYGKKGHNNKDSHSINVDIWLEKFQN